MDLKQPFKLIKANDFHRIAPNTRKKLMKGWHTQAFTTGLVNEGQTRRQSCLNLAGSHQLIMELKSILENDYYDEF